MKLPDYLIIGMQRCGTTSLFLYCCQHPGMSGMSLNLACKRPQRGSEIHFFDYERHYAKGIEWYAGLASNWSGVVGEKSPTYLHCRKAPARVARHMPDVKLIVLLRNPVDRAYSHYHKAVRVGYEGLRTFEAALDAEPDRLARHDPAGDFENSPRHLHAYVERGYYADCLEHWFGLFDRRQFFIIQSEALFMSPDRTTAEVWRWLGLDPADCKNRKVKYAYQVGDYEPMDPETRARLLEHFAPYNRTLERLLGRRMIGWDR